MPGRDAEGAFVRCAGLVSPDSAHRFRGSLQGHVRDQLPSLWRCQALYAVHPGGLFPCVFLCHPAPREAVCAPGRGEKLLESAGLLGLSTGRCVSDASLELADSPLELAPGDGMPCLPRTVVMAHDVGTLLEDSLVDVHRSPVGVSLAFHVGCGFGGDPCRLTRAGVRRPSPC
jgi:hypothetical protein